MRAGAAIETVGPIATDDPYFSLPRLAAYSGLSVRTLRDYLRDPVGPLPHFRTKGKILVRRSEFDAWMRRFRAGEPSADLGRMVDDVLEAFM
jgi:Helix-turn-helix domain